MHYSYLPGGDVGDVTCTVRTLRRVSLELPGLSLLWSLRGGKPCQCNICCCAKDIAEMVLSADGR
jgi:hypothetical protein